MGNTPDQNFLPDTKAFLRRHQRPQNVLPLGQSPRTHSLGADLPTVTRKKRKIPIHGNRLSRKRRTSNDFELLDYHLSYAMVTCADQFNFAFNNDRKKNDDIMTREFFFDYEHQIGFSGFDSLGQNPDFRFDYWYGVHDALDDIGCKVHTARVPAFAGVQERAERLKEYIERSLPHGAEVNLIGNNTLFGHLVRV